MKTLAMIFLMLPTLAFAQYTAPTGYALIGNIPGQALQKAGAMPAANWQIIVSGAPGALAPLALFDGAYESDNAAVVIETRNGNVAMGQYANGTACETSAGLPSEFDVDVSPEASAKPAVAPALSAMSALTIAGNVVIEAAGATPGASPCKINKTSATVGVVLIDNAVTPAERLFYTVQLFASAGDPVKPPGWYWTGDHVTAGVDEWGYSDIPASYGASPPTVGDHSVALSFDVLPKISTLITSGGKGIDPDLAHWSLAGVSYGQAHWGDAYLVTAWSGWVPQVVGK